MAIPVIFQNSFYIILAKLNHKHFLSIKDVMSSLPLLSKSRRKCFHHLPLLLVKKWPPTLYPLISCWGYTVMCINILPKICPFLFPVSYFLLPPAFFFSPWPFSFLPQAFFFYRGNFSFAETYFFFVTSIFLLPQGFFFCR